MAPSTAFALVLLAVRVSGVAAPALSLSTNSLQSDFVGPLTHTITGLAPSETVVVERFADVNNNGAIDFGEPPLRSFTVTDGARPIIGGVVNGNVPGDDDATANGAIRIDLPFAGVDPIFNRQPGKYVIRVTGSSGQATQPFEITAPNLPQRITGALKNSANNGNISFGFVIVLVGDGEPIASVRTDSTGAYSYIAPPGDYLLIPFADGFVADPQFVNLPANQVVTHNLSLTPAPVRVSGKLTDSATSGGLASVFVLAQVSDGPIGGALTDSNGNFSFGVTAGSWEINALAQYASQLGYIVNEQGVFITAASAPITQNISARKATALVYGRASNPSSVPIPNLQMRGRQDNPIKLESNGRTSATGDYFVGVTSGDWEIRTEGASFLGFREETHTLTIVDGTATRSDFSLAGFTAHVRGRVVDSSGNGISGVTLEGHFENSNNTSSSSTTGADGSFDVPVWAGNWSFRLDQDAQRINHTVLVTVVDGVDQTITFNVPNSTGNITGSVKNTSNQGIPDAFVNAQANINGIDYETSGRTDGAGQFSLPAINGTWNLSLSCDDLQNRNYECPSNQSATINSNSATVNFTLQTFLTTASLNGRVVDSNGAGLSGVQIGAFKQSGGSRSTSTQGDGSFSIPVYAGQWTLQIFNTLPGLVGPSLAFTVTDGVNVNNIQVKVLPTDTTISGTLKNSSGTGLGGISIFANATINNANYSVSPVITDPSGNFNFAVARGSWNVNVNCNELNNRQYNCVNNQTADTTSGPAIVNFVVTPQGSSGPPQIEAPTLNQSGQIPIFRFTLRGSPGTYDILGAPAIPFAWTQIATTTITFGGDISTAEFNPGTNRFFRVQLRP